MKARKVWGQPPFLWVLGGSRSIYFHIPWYPNALALRWRARPVPTQPCGSHPTCNWATKGLWFLKGWDPPRFPKHSHVTCLYNWRKNTDYAMFESYFLFEHLWFGVHFGLPRFWEQYHLCMTDTWWLCDLRNINWCCLNVIGAPKHPKTIGFPTTKDEELAAESCMGRHGLRNPLPSCLAIRLDGLTMTCFLIYNIWLVVWLPSILFSH